MQPYPGNSNLTHFEIGDDYVRVWFDRTRSYTYSYGGKAGQNIVDQMKRLCMQGSGLSSFITKNARNLAD